MMTSQFWWWATTRQSDDWFQMQCTVSCPTYRSNQLPSWSALINSCPNAARSPTFLANGVACVAISRSEGELDKDKLHETMAHPIELGEALKPGR